LRDGFGRNKAYGIDVKLQDKDRFGSDDTMAKNKTNGRGEFWLIGGSIDLGTIEPRFKIYHRCNDGLLASTFRCPRRWKIKVPSKYIYSDINAPIVFDAGSMNLESIFTGGTEDRDCIH